MRVELSFRNKIARFLKTSSHWFAQFRRRDERTRFAFISLPSAIQSLAIRFTGLTSSSIWNLSRPVGRRNSKVNYSCRAMPFTQPSSRSRIGRNGRARRQLKCSRCLTKDISNSEVCPGPATESQFAIAAFAFRHASHHLSSPRILFCGCN